MIRSAELATELKAGGERPQVGSGVADPSPTNLPQKAVSTDTATSGPPGERQKLRFLVIEDMVELADLMVECLRALDFEAEVASTREAALRLLSSRPFDVALVDIDLPDTTGFEVVALATTLGWLGRTQIVFCTGSQAEEYQQRAARFPGSHFLLKPFTFPDLMKCVSEITADQIEHEPRGTCQPDMPRGLRRLSNPTNAGAHEVDQGSEGRSARAGLPTETSNSTRDIMT